MDRCRLSLTVVIAGLAIAACGCTAAAPAQPVLTDADAAPATTTPTATAPASPGGAAAEGKIVDKDPVTERSAQVDFSWQQYCYSSDYQLQIAKDSEFTIIVLDTGAYSPASADSPAAYYPAGGLARSPSSLTGWGQLEAGKTYYWRVRVVRAATGECIRSPWSEVKSFTVEP